MKITAYDPDHLYRIATGTGMGSSAGGDLSGTLPGPTVVGIHGTSISSNAPTTVGDVLTIFDTTVPLAGWATPSNATGSNSMTRTLGGQSTVVTHAASGAARQLDIGGGNSFDVTLTANCTLSIIGAPATGEAAIVIGLRQDGTGNRTVTWPGSVVWAAGTAPTLSTGANEVDFFVLFTWDAGSTWFGFPAGGGASFDDSANPENVGTTGTGNDAFAARRDHVHAATLDNLSNVTVPSPTTGDMLRWNGTAWVNTAGRWATVYAVAQRNLDLWSATDDTTIANTTTETTLFGTGEGSVVLPPDFFTAGKSLHIMARGQLSDTGTPNFTIRIKLGTTTICSVGPTALTGVASTEWMLDAILTCRTVNGTGTFIAGGLFDYDDGTELSLSSATEINLSTLVSHTLGVTWEWGTANAANTITCQDSTVTVIDPNRVGVGGLEPVLTPGGDDVLEGWVE